MTQTIPRPRTEQLSSPDDLARQIGTKILEVCPDYNPGDRIEGDYGTSIPGILGVCGVTIEAGGITRVFRENEEGRRVGVLSSKDRSAGIWVTVADGLVGMPDTTTPDAAAWITGELETFSNNMEHMKRQGALRIIPAKDHRRAG